MHWRIFILWKLRLLKVFIPSVFDPLLSIFIVWGTPLLPIDLFRNFWAEPFILRLVSKKSMVLPCLSSIALQDPMSGGPGVYLARTMLGLTIMDISNNSNSRIGNIQQQTDAVEEENHILVYPNPAQGQISIEFDNVVENGCEIIIFNIFGQEIINQRLDGNTKYTINISELNSGVYFYTVISNGELLIKDKFIKL